jgi:hypothetical protein
MNTKDLSLDHCSDSKVVKHFGGVFPRIGITILPDALIVISVDCGGLSHFVVSS